MKTLPLSQCFQCWKASSIARHSLSLVGHFSSSLAHLQQHKYHQRQQIHNNFNHSSAILKQSGTLSNLCTSTASCFVNTASIRGSTPPSFLECLLGPSLPDTRKKFDARLARHEIVGVALLLGHPRCLQIKKMGRRIRNSKPNKGRVGAPARPACQK